MLGAPFHAIAVSAGKWKLMLLLVGGCHGVVVAPHLPSEKELGAGKAQKKALQCWLWEGIMLLVLFSDSAG